MKNSLVDAAVACFQEGKSCSQAILMTYGQQCGLDEQTAKKVARSFGGGMGRTGQTCGAVTGAFIVLGLRNDDINEKLAKENTFAQIQEFSQRFRERFGDVNCQRLLGCDLATAEGQDYFRSNNLKDKCSNFVKAAAILLEELNSYK